MKNIKGILYAITSSATFGLIPLFAIPVLRTGEMGTLSILFYRFGFGALMMGALALMGGKSFRISAREAGTLALFGFNYVATALGLLYSYNLVTSGVATTIHSLYPIVVSAIMILLFKEKKSPVLLLATVISVCGVWLLCWTEGEMSVKGIVILLGTVVTYSIYIVSMSRSKVRRLDPMPLNFYILAVAAGLVGSVSFFEGGVAIIPDNFILGNLLLLAFIPTVISNIALILAVKFAGSVKTSILGAMEPATAIAVGVFYFNEPFSLRNLLGFGLIVVATILVVASNSKRA